MVISPGRVETEARADLERRYLGGHAVLFADAAEAWAGHLEAVVRLAGLADAIEANEAIVRWRVDRRAGRSSRHPARLRRSGEGL